MTAEQITTIIVNLLTSTTILGCAYLWVRGVRREISSLNRTIETQNKTLEVMEKRIVETEKVSAIYKNLVEELPAFMEKYKTFISSSKDTIIAELEQANQFKDEKLKESRELDLRKLELQEQMLAELPTLREQLIETTTAIQERFNAMGYYNPYYQFSNFILAKAQPVLLQSKMFVIGGAVEPQEEGQAAAEKPSTEEP